MAVHTKGGSPQGHRVFEIMSTEIQCCSPQDDLSKAEKLMIVAQVRRLPVCDGEGQLVGLLSLNDIARKAVQEEGKKRIPSSLGASDVVHTLAAIGQPRLVAAGV
jgi:CBS-domain-containing membrane protein